MGSVLMFVCVARLPNDPKLCDGEGGGPARVTAEALRYSTLLGVSGFMN